jgi:hypothetical protein
MPFCTDADNILTVECNICNVSKIDYYLNVQDMGTMKKMQRIHFHFCTNIMLAHYSCLYQPLSLMYSVHDDKHSVLLSGILVV